MDRLRQSEGRFRLLIEGVIDSAIFMIDCEGRLFARDTGANRIEGYAAAEISGQHFSKSGSPHFGSGNRR